MTANDDSPTPTLTALADAHGIATEYWSFFGDRVHVPATTLRLILHAMGIDAEDEPSAAAALAAADEAPWRSLLPPSAVVRRGAGEVLVHVADGCDVEIAVTLEDGSRRSIPIPDQEPESRTIDGRRVWRVRVPLPPDLPLGWHLLRAGEHRHGVPSRAGQATLVVTPDRISPPPTRRGAGDRAWGLMAQLYSVRSRESWGIGDFADLGDLATVAAEHGADFLLVNPIHAAEVTTPIEPSPYLPATRRFIAPLYVRPEDIREASYLSAADRALLAAAKAPAAATDTDAERVDRDLAWTAKLAALEIVHAAPRTAARQHALDAFTAAGGTALEDFALWCALEEHYAGLPAGTTRPDEARDIRSPLVAQLRAQLADRIAFHTWLQWVADEQAQAAHRAAREAGMSIGVMHDLAVGVDPKGSDAWSLRDLYAPGIRVGAPPDMYNQQGQDWSQPPWLPPALAATGYAALRDMIRNLLRHAGALRIDHVIGLFRLWWIPAGQGPTTGTYVRYDHEAMIGVLALEAERAGAVVIGEDLGNVEPWVRDYLSSRGVLGTSVLWFEYEGESFRPPEHYREAVLATVNTHDLPPTAGYLALEHVDLRARLGLLTQPLEEVRAEAIAERDRMLQVLRERGLIGADATEQEVVEALHVLLTASPSLLLGVGLVDAVGERRVQNQPGTHREYPNWQVPLAGPDGACILIEDLAANERFVSLTAAVSRALRNPLG
ncbi:4-alpha-glucanotransferase [Microbacterium sp. SS28]|uniref:4-alpha-glucanotransferase n=1 Tax=Microbacterium sp. SS28 TaxID=2919948 RepID=UPI001FAA3683|nr:4-alpha-glucanotransferase [Microbacterium sp. SS28]